MDFRSTFDDGTIGPWEAVQRALDRPLAESFTFVSRPVRSGPGAARFVVHHGYGDVNGDEAVELCCGPIPHEQQGTSYWYAWSTLFAAPWHAPYRWGIFAQWHSDYGIPPPLDFSVDDRAIWVQLHSGQVDPRAATWEYERSLRIVRGVAPGRWHDFVLHVVWSASRDGSVEVWHRLAGERHFVRVLTLRRVPTLQRAGADASPNYMLLGLYRASYCTKPFTEGCTSPLGVQPDSVVYQDEFRRSTTMFSWCLACRSSTRATGTRATAAQ